MLFKRKPREPVHKLKLTKQAIRNTKSLEKYYNTPEGKEARLEGYEWCSKVLNS